jgi:hypothetical protein
VGVTGGIDWAPMPWLKERWAARDAAFKASQDAASARAKRDAGTGKAKTAPTFSDGCIPSPSEPQGDAPCKAQDRVPVETPGAALPSGYFAAPAKALDSGLAKAPEVAGPKGMDQGHGPRASKGVSQGPPATLDAAGVKRRGKGSLKGKGQGHFKAQDAAPSNPRDAAPAKPRGTPTSKPQGKAASTAQGTARWGVAAIVADVENAIINGLSGEQLDERTNELLSALFKGRGPGSARCIGAALYFGCLIKSKLVLALKQQCFPGVSI